MTGGGKGVVLREAGPLDARVIAELHRLCFADVLGDAVWSVASINRIFSLSGSYAYLAVVAPEPATLVPAGFLLARIQSGKSEILSLGVIAAWRRQGAARALLRAAMARAGLAGATRTLLEVAEDNMAARRLYAAEGFAFVQRWPRYYRRPGATAAATATTALVFAHDLPRCEGRVRGVPESKQQQGQ